MLYFDGEKLRVDTTIPIEKYIQYFDHDQEYDEFEPIESNKDAMMNEIERKVNS